MKKKVILITGTSRGIGKGIYEFLKSEGQIVYGSSREAFPHNPYHLKIDVTNPDQCEEAVKQIIAKEGRLDVLVNNAGYHMTGASEEVSIEELHQQMAINFFGAVPHDQSGNWPNVDSEKRKHYQH